MVIGLTGGIASGKTLVSSMLQDRGAHIICADAISRELLAKKSPVLELIREAFGDGVFQQDGTLDRKALANIIFETEFERKRLEAILHPLVFEEIFKRIYKLKRAQEDPIIVVDAALLIESGLYKCMDKVWVVISSEQMDRLIKRDKLSEDEAKKRLNAQLDTERRLRHADAFIDNSFGLDRTEEQVEELFTQLKGGIAANG